MSSFNVHFFKEYEKGKLTPQEILDFLELKGIFKFASSEDKATVIYDHPRLPYSCRIVITKGSVVTNLYQLNPSYKDLKMHLEIDVNIPNYVAREFLFIANTLCERFDLDTYNEFLENISKFNVDSFLRIFSSYKETYLEKNPMFAERFQKISETKMEAILKYMDERQNLEKFFRDSQCSIPKYHFLKGYDRKIKLAINWTENTATIFPPFIDYIYYRKGELILFYEATELFDVLNPYLENIPGFTKEAKMISISSIKKATKAISKARLNSKIANFSSSSLDEIID